MRKKATTTALKNSAILDIRTPRVFLYLRGWFDRVFHRIGQTEQGDPDSAFLRRHRQRYAAYTAKTYGKLEEALRQDRIHERNLVDLLDGTTITDKQTDVTHTTVDVQQLRANARNRQRCEAQKRSMEAKKQELIATQFKIRSTETVCKENLLAAAYTVASKLESYAAGAFRDRYANLSIDLYCPAAVKVYESSHPVNSVYDEETHRRAS